MRQFYDLMIQIATATTTFNLAIATNNLLRYYPVTQRLVVILFILLIPVFGFSIYNPKYRLVSISLLSAFCLGMIAAWLI